MNGGEAAMILTLGICGVCVLAILKIVADALQSHMELQHLVADCENRRAEHANHVRQARQRHAKTRKSAERQPELAQAA